jgi:hypothetical protein
MCLKVKPIPREKTKRLITKEKEKPIYACMCHKEIDFPQLQHITVID